MILLNDYLKKEYGCKVYKLSLQMDVTCPVRDGSIDTRGCIFCSGGGSGEFASCRTDPIADQLAEAKKKVAAKAGKDAKYIAYFQAYTGTYAPIARLEKLYMDAIDHPDIVALSIATRPDCLPDDVLELLSKCNQIKPVWVELGLQTIHENTAKYIRRGYDLKVYDEAVQKLRKRGIEVITHVILGLPGENEKDMLETVSYVCGLSGATHSSLYHATGIKLQLLHILKGTDLETEYKEGRLTPLTEDEYISLLKKCVSIIPDDVVIHRLTGDGDKKILLAPLWSADKKHVWNRIQKEIIPASSQISAFS